MDGIDVLLIENFEIKLKKQNVVRNQQYEKAAELRDMQKTVERKVWNLLTGESSDYYDWKKYEELVRSYIKKKYDIDYIDSSYKQIVRDIKLKSIGL